MSPSLPAVLLVQDEVKPMGWLPVMADADAAVNKAPTHCAAAAGTPLFGRF